MLNYKALIEKYDVAVPRYTSYPTVPYWDSTPTQDEWLHMLSNTYASAHEKEISLYVHLPFCEQLCTFCGCNKRITKNHRVELPYMNALIKEFEIYVAAIGSRPVIKEIHLGGGTPTFFAPESLAYLLEEILNRSTIATHSELSFEAHPHSTKEAHMQTLAHYGFNRMSLGVQDVDTRVNEIINRSQTKEEIIMVTQQARALGYRSINLDLIYGLPEQNTQTMAATLALVEVLRPERIALYSFAFIPWLRPEQRKFTEHDLPSKDRKRALYEQAKTTLLDIGYEEIGMDHFALPIDSLAQSLHNKTLHRNFMGYTSAYSQILIGLGCSAIGDVWGAFMQNEKKVEDYQTIISEGRLPIYKGHILTEEDRRVRTHILHLMCQFETIFSDEDADIFNVAQERLADLSQDGLCTYDDHTRHVKVTERGKPFLRNICGAFDLRLWRKQPTQNLFSKSI